MYTVYCNVEDATPGIFSALVSQVPCCDPGFAPRQLFGLNTGEASQTNSQLTLYLLVSLPSWPFVYHAKRSALRLRPSRVRRFGTIRRTQTLVHSTCLVVVLCCLARSTVAFSSPPRSRPPSSNSSRKTGQTAGRRQRRPKRPRSAARPSAMSANGRSRIPRFRSSTATRVS